MGSVCGRFGSVWLFPAATSFEGIRYSIPFGLGSVWARFGSVWLGLGIARERRFLRISTADLVGLGSVWTRFGLGLARFGLGFGSVFHRTWVGLGSV